MIYKKREEQPTIRNKNIALGRKNKERLRTEKANESERKYYFWTMVSNYLWQKMKRLPIFFAPSG